MKTSEQEIAAIRFVKYFVRNTHQQPTFMCSTAEQFAKNKALLKANSVQKQMTRKENQLSSRTDARKDSSVQKKCAKNSTMIPSSTSTKNKGADSSPEASSWKTPKVGGTKGKSPKQRKKPAQSPCTISMPVVEAEDPSLLAVEEVDRPEVYIDRDVYEASTLYGGQSQQVCPTFEAKTLA